jgi:hypothetical protein
VETISDVLGLLQTLATVNKTYAQSLVTLRVPEALARLKSTAERKGLSSILNRIARLRATLAELPESVVYV